MRYPNGGRTPLTFAKIANVVGGTRQAYSQRENVALKRIRMLLDKKEKRNPPVDSKAA